MVDVNKWKVSKKLLEKKMMGRMKREKIILFQRRLNNLKHKFHIGIAA